MDCSIIPSRHKGLFLVSTTDFFYPLVEDPYMQGRIACANVLSDMYAMGVTNVDNMLMILGASVDMEVEQRLLVTRQMIRGFHDLAVEAGTLVSGGQSVLNPWPIIGGVAMSTCAKEEIIVPVGAQPGDVLVLTKPLGTQVAVNAHQWLHQDKYRSRLDGLLTRAQVLRAYATAVESMSRLNRNAALMMHRFHAHAATDVTGFGILGHATNLAQNQDACVQLEIHTLPLIHGMQDVDALSPNTFKLMLGFSAETSGGLLVALPQEDADAFVSAVTEADGQPAWIIGRVLQRPEGQEANGAHVVAQPSIIHV